jgi:hypothetical protein
VSRFATRLTTLAIFSMALIAAPAMTPAFASAGDPPVATDTSKEKPKKSKKSGKTGSSIDHRLFDAGHRAV